MKEWVRERFKCGKRRRALLRERRREAVTAQTATSSSTISMGCGSVERYLVIFVTRVVPLRETVIRSVGGLVVGSEKGFAVGSEFAAAFRIGLGSEFAFRFPFPLP